MSNLKDLDLRYRALKQVTGYFIEAASDGNKEAAKVFYNVAKGIHRLPRPNPHTARVM